MNISKLPIIIFLFFLLHSTFAHNGRLAADGCHNDTSTNTRHCHSDTVQEKNNNTTINTDYNRKDYKHWIDIDKDCQNTRQEVLIEENIGALVLSSDGCKVISGKWYDPYTGNTYTNPQDLDVDHYVPLKEAHISGAKNWNARKKELYANYLADPDHLIAVSKLANRSKGAKDPSQWMPPNNEYKCQYLKIWTSIKRAWELDMDTAEIEAIKSERARWCGS